MRRYTLFLLLLCMHCIARGQTGFDYRYWFDNDYSTVRQGHSETDKWQVDADIDGLSESLHSIHIQVVDSKGVESAPITRHFYRIIAPESATYRCWVDDDPTTMTTGKYTGSPIMVDISSISEGYHVMRVQIEDVTPSAVVSCPFVKIPQTEGVEYLKCLCVVDDVFYKEENVTSAGGIINWNFDVSSLQQGFHRMQVQVITPSGAATSTYNAFFLRTTTDTEMADMKCVYAIDGNEFNTEAGRMSNGAFHCDLDVAHLSDGLHRIAYMLTNGKGVETKVQTQFFVKTPLGGNGITQYQYWLNDNDDNKQTVTLAERQDPFSLISLIPVESQPIRSSCFEFRVEEGAPILYAKNDFHIRFYDVSARFTDACKQYVDERVSEAVVPVGELQTRQSFDKVPDGDIRWYTISLEEGDSVAFRTSQACSMQLYSPSGEELYNASGLNSVEYGGCHTWEDGMYYLAIHDVTGSQSTMHLDYMHMDRYDVVGQDVAIVGNGGCSTITFTGNGFKDLYAVDLFNANGDTIHHVFIGHESDASTSVVFDFTGATIGTYNAKFYFSEEDKTFADLMTVEEAVDIELATTVTYPSVFLRGTATTYTIKITNKGNLTAYQVPIYTYIMNKINEDDISYIKYEGLNLEGIFDGVNTDSLSDIEIQELHQLSETLGDGHHFLRFHVEDENSPGDSMWVRSNYFFTNISPNETKTLRLHISAVDSVWAYLTVPDDWSTFRIIHQEASKRRLIRSFKSSNQRSSYCCWADKIDCVLSTASYWLDMTSAVSFVFGPHFSAAIGAADCATSVAASVNKTAKIIGCGDEGSEDNLRDMAGKAVKSAISAAISCVSAKLAKYGFKYLKSYNPRLANLGTGLSALVGYLDMSTPTDGDFSCFKEWSKPKPNCPPTPPHGGTSTPVNSLDPNDIYGYTSESGSKFITDSIQALNYTIEFENDTAFATSSAHVVVVTDTLDGRYFDLKSFKPTAIKIGDKTVELDGTQNFVKTIDVRPAINAIAQIEGRYDAKKGIAIWTFTSLDPMTMEPTDDVMQGFLPINYDGTSGMGQVMFDINLKQKFDNGTEIPNRAGIVFDSNDVIMTPTWVNTIDAIAPTSRVTDCEVKSSTTATLHLKGNDNMSGVWKYDVYVQYGEDASWFKCQENVTDTLCDVRIYSGMNHGFMVIATDSAGNREIKELHSVCRLITIEKGDINSDGEVTAQDASLVQQYVAGKITLVDESIADVNNDGKVDAQDASLIQQYVAGKISW